MKLPISLVKTWLELSGISNPISQEAHNNAINKLLYHFDNISEAEDYVEHSKCNIND